MKHEFFASQLLIAAIIDSITPQDDKKKKKTRYHQWQEVLAKLSTKSVLGHRHNLKHMSVSEAT